LLIRSLLYRSLHISNIEVINSAFLARIDHNDFEGKILGPFCESSQCIIVWNIDLRLNRDCVSSVEAQIFSLRDQEVRRSHLMHRKSWHVGYNYSFWVIANRCLAEKINWSCDILVSNNHRHIWYSLCHIV
jgi:hypothetical protein